MSNIMLVKLQEKHFEKLFKFELENRGYFEEMVPSRGDDYYNLETFIQRNKALIDEQDQGLSFFYLIMNQEGVVLGRMNLVDIEQPKRRGHVGYRVGKAYTGKGIANKALRILLDTTNQLGIRQISAKTTTINIASRKILEKNEFQYIETAKDEFKMNGHLLSFIYYRWEKS